MTKPTIDLLTSDAVSIVLLNAISEQVPPDSAAFGAIGATHGKVTIQLFLNGVEIPDPVGALTKVINGELARIDEHASTKAIQMIGDAGLDGIAEALDKTRRTMEDARFELKKTLREKAGAVFYDDEDR